MIPSSSTKALKIEETILQWKESLAPRTSSDQQQTNKDWLSVALGIFFSEANLWHKIAEWLKHPDLCEGSREHGEVYLWPHGTYINMHHAKATCQCPMFLFGPEPFTQIQDNPSISTTPIAMASVRPVPSMLKSLARIGKPAKGR